MMAGFEPGGSARVLGPLGNGWIIEEGMSWMLIGGGLGAAGFQFLIDRAECRNILIGAASGNRLLPLDGVSGITVATEDGSEGTRGLVTDILSTIDVSNADCIALCGPVAMMEAVWRRVPGEYRNRIQVSTESRMGCGWGVCDGCSIPVADGGFRKCCSDGPVFRGVEIDWKRWKEAGL